jgi:2-keto-4-pentenoate hydratase/2-oxohepta-3-ene-1,7-dioic acid hydratase in catechol pathway
VKGKSAETFNPAGPFLVTADEVPGFSPQVWLRPGDVIELGIEGLGTRRQMVVPPR